MTRRLRKWEQLTDCELSELEIALAHRLDERHAFVWRSDARRMIRGVEHEWKIRCGVHARRHKELEA